MNSFPVPAGWAIVSIVLMFVPLAMLFALFRISGHLGRLNRRVEKLTEVIGRGNWPPS